VVDNIQLEVRLVPHKSLVVGCIQLDDKLEQHTLCYMNLEHSKLEQHKQLLEECMLVHILVQHMLVHILVQHMLELYILPSCWS
jgi:hypothetical protein